MNNIIERLKSEKSVVVYRFNQDEFLRAVKSAGLNVCGGADIWDGNGDIYAKIFYI